MMSDYTKILFPALEPQDQGWLAVSGGHQLYYEVCGNPGGAPVIFLHGGPGSGCNSMQRRFFDPVFYRIILFDQRGCGRSLPSGCIENNTTQYLIKDIESLRIHLDIQHWLVFGGSWGSTLALAYATTHAQVIRGMILRGIFLCRQSELDWFLYEVRNFFPEAWQRMTAPLTAEQQKDILRAYHSLVFSGDVSAARTWNTFEHAIISLIPGDSSSNMPNDNVTLARARVQLHYLVNLGFLQQPLLERIDCFRQIPAIIIQGRYDMVCPPITAIELHQAWPEAQYIVIPDAGHSAMEPGTATALVAATESFKQYC